MVSERAQRRPWQAYLELVYARWSLLAALGALGLGTFVKLATELREGEIQRTDQVWLEHIVAQRVPSWNGYMLELSALGSGLVITLFVVIAVFGLLVARDRLGALQLTLAAVGGACFSALLKNLLERQRPNVALRLSEVTSYSFPSGHSLASATVYLTLALILAQRLPTLGSRVGLFAIVLLLDLSIGFSRAYIGVHFPSDIAAGLAFGWGWALLVSAAFSYLRARA